MKSFFAVLVVFFAVFFSGCVQKKIDLNFQDESFIFQVKFASMQEAEMFF